MPRRCDPSKPFKQPELVDALSLPSADTVSVRFSPDALFVVFARAVPDSGTDLFSASRFSVTDAFTTPIPLTALNTDVNEGKPTFPDTREAVYFHRSRLVDRTASDIYRAQRTANGFENPVRLADGVVNTTTGGKSQDPYVSADEQELYFVSDRSAQLTIWVATQPNGGDFGAVDSVPSTMIAPFVDSPVISHDKRTLYFGAGDDNSTAIWMARRDDTTGKFGAATQVAGPELDVVGMRDEPSYITPDDCTIYFYSDRTANVFATYRAERER